MNNKGLFNQLVVELKDRIHFLEDKPEETLESTIKALWHAAAGSMVSAEKAMSLMLPELSPVQINKLKELINRRLSNVPLAHITKRQNFMGVEFIADSRALIPRKETEILGKKALDTSFSIQKNNGEINVIDVCCGAGNLGLAIVHFNPNCKVFMSDISEEALELAQENVKFLDRLDRVSLVKGDLFSGFESDNYYGKINLIVCNPPYITTAKVGKMNSEIAQYEPVLAFDGGMLGLKIIQKLINEAPKFLAPGGWLIFEVGLGQGDFIGRLIEKSPMYQKNEMITDDSGNVRVVVAQKII